MAKTRSMDDTLVAPRFLFRFAVDVRRATMPWPVRGVASRGTLLDESFSLISLGELDGERGFADVRMAWSPEGLIWTVAVAGKTQLPWCRESRLEDSDGLQVWVDTRCTTNVHRATRFCHRFVFLPRGGGRDAADPVADQLLINRARENARPVRPRELQVRSRVTATGYELAAFAPAAVLGGYDVRNGDIREENLREGDSSGGQEGNQRLGFTFALLDRELGLQTFSAGAGFPYEEDPSCWAEVALVD